jgi:hypothetical protein
MDRLGSSPCLAKLRDSSAEKAFYTFAHHIVIINDKNSMQRFSI